ncbi:MAG: pyrimidine operon attenuation protein/uracil phosphoribosyltransferase [Paraglaciecola sp.]|jgi:pyrimidine operon attenuation protein/uracil phosphoribosyltransferase
MQILNERQIGQKVRRLAIQILENNYSEKEIILAGINDNGLHFADLLLKELLERTDIKITVTRIQINPAKPLSEDIILEMPIKEVKNKVIILIDDVANTGRTIFYATKPLMEVMPKKIEVAVLVDRKHKSFPIRVDYVGLSLATTVKEHIDVQIRGVEEVAVYLN